MPELPLATQSRHPGSGREQVWKAVLPLPLGTGPLCHRSQATDPPPPGLVVRSLLHTLKREQVLLKLQGPGVGVGGWGMGEITKPDLSFLNTQTC